MDEKQYNLSAPKSLFLFLILPFPGHSGAAFSSPHEGHSSLCPALCTMTAPAAIILFLSHSSSVLEVQMSPDFQDQSCSSLHLPNKQKKKIHCGLISPCGPGLCEPSSKHDATTIKGLERDTFATSTAVISLLSHQKIIPFLAFL